jgi:hypothetical protein
LEVEQIESRVNNNNNNSNRRRGLTKDEEEPIWIVIVLKTV